jgi:hypothetical protein
VEKEIVRHPEYEPVAEQIFNSIYKHLRLSHEMEKTKVPPTTTSSPPPSSSSSSTTTTTTKHGLVGFRVCC